MIENIVIHQIVDCDVIDHGGKQFVNIKNIHTRVSSIGHYSMKYESSNTIPLITAMVNRIMNANWRIVFEDIKSQLEYFVSEDIKAFLTPISKKIPIQEFYQCNP